MFIEVRDKNTHKLLFKYDPIRELVEIKIKDVLVLVDLTEYKEMVISQRSVPLHGAVTA